MAVAFAGGRLERRLQLRTFEKHVFMDPLWTRVWDPAEEDFAADRIYAGDPRSDDPEYVTDREDLEPLVQERWLRHVATDVSLHNIRTLGEDLKKIEGELDKAVATARSEGISWDRIGRAVGITRQGAQSDGTQANALRPKR